jgi:hypothetical protein
MNSTEIFLCAVYFARLTWPFDIQLIDIWRPFLASRFGPGAVQQREKRREFRGC